MIILLKVMSIRRKEKHTKNNNKKNTRILRQTPGMGARPSDVFICKCFEKSCGKKNVVVGMCTIHAPVQSSPKMQPQVFSKWNVLRPLYIVETTYQLWKYILRTAKYILSHFPVFKYLFLFYAGINYIIVSFFIIFICYHW